MARARGQKSAPITFDFNTVEATDAEMPKRLQASKVDKTPFPKWYYESWESGVAKSIPLPNQAAVDEAKKLAQTAAKRFGIMYDAPKAGLRTHSTGNAKDGFVFTFLAVDRAKTGESDETEDESAEEE